MGLATDLMMYFDIHDLDEKAGNKTPPNLGDFFEKYPHYNEGNVRALNVCTRLVEKGYLVFLYTIPGKPNLFGNVYISHSSGEVNRRNAEYGIYEFAAGGFQYIREHFLNSVRPIYVQELMRDDGCIKDSVGSGFLISDNCLVTAAHCVVNKYSLSIPNLNDRLTKISQIFVPLDSNLDLALIFFDQHPFAEIPTFKLRLPQMLEEVLTMGFPDIPGFDRVLVAEKAHISGYLKSSVGQVVGKEDSYLGKQTYLLITARVKGGNSGGPVISEDGHVIGIVTEFPEFNNRSDTLGYGVITPSDNLIGCLNGLPIQQKFVPLSIEATDSGRAIASKFSFESRTKKDKLEPKKRGSKCKAIQRQTSKNILLHSKIHE